MTTPASRIPHVIPYQGSKRRLAARIAALLPRGATTFYEPFAGSAAMTLWAAHHNLAPRFVLGEVCEPLASLWRQVLHVPDQVVARYRTVWAGQRPGDAGYFNRVRGRFNVGGDPVLLLYLLARCVKNSPRWNATGGFSQSVDKRRLGLTPEAMGRALLSASRLLAGRTTVRAGDWLATTYDAKPQDFLYLDPPYEGTSTGKDRRYAQSLPRAELLAGLRHLLARHLPFALSYDGTTGGKHYGAALPADLLLAPHTLMAGRSSQATLLGRHEGTEEALYLSPHHPTLPPNAVPP